MNPADVERSIVELTKLAEEFRAKASVPDGKGAEQLIAGVGYVLTTTATMVAECKRQLDQIASEQRRSGKDADSLQGERAAHFFASLKPEDRNRLVEKVETTAPNITIEAFAEHIATELRFPNWQVAGLLQWIGRWYAYLATRETEEDVNSIANIFVDPDNVETSTGELLRAVDAVNLNSVFMQQFKRLLRCHATLGVTRKAEMLLGRSERKFRSAAVSTDLRRIFGGNVETAPLYGVILHDLILGINDGGTSRFIGVTLTSGDILNLADVLDRAWKKDKTLRQHAAYKVLPLKTNK